MLDTNFAASSTRHLRDACLLLEEDRFDNSFYHSGYVAECALKAVAEGAGLAARRLGHKLLKLEGDALDLAMAITPATARYRPPASSVRSINAVWSPSCRYSSDIIRRPQAESILLDAKRVWEDCIGQMFLDGLIQELP